MSVVSSCVDRDCSDERIVLTFIRIDAGLCLEDESVLRWL
jgi:hypothetical protein